MHYRVLMLTLLTHPFRSKVLAKLSLALTYVAVLSLPAHTAVAGLDLTCPRIVHKDSWTSYSAVTQALEEPVAPYMVMTSVFDRNGWPENRPPQESDRLAKVTEMIGLIEKDVAEEALAFTVEAIYKVYDPRQLPNSLYRTEVKRIAQQAAHILCSSGCQGSGRKQLAERAQVHVDQWVESGVPRMSLSDIEEHLKINYQGLNSILKYRSDELGLPHFDSYRHHFLTLLSEFPGPLMRTQVMERRAGRFFTREDLDVKNGEVITPEYRTDFSSFRVKQALDQFFDSMKLRWKNFNHASLLKFSVFEQLSLFNIINQMEGSDRIEFDGPSPLHERLLLLSKYMISAPLAVARVLTENEGLQDHFCWIVEEMDRVISSNHINSSVAGLHNYIMPMTIGLLVFAAPFSAGLWMAGLVALNIVTAIDLAARARANQRLYEEINFYRRHELPNTFNLSSLDNTEARRQTYESNQKMIRNIMFMEVLFGGVAIGVSRVSRKIITKMSHEKKIQILQRPFQEPNMGSLRRQSRRSRNRSVGARLRTNDALEKVIRRNDKAYGEALFKYNKAHGTMTHEQLIAFNIGFFLKNGTRTEVLKLLVKNRYTAFGSMALNIEAANEMIEQIYVHINTAPMSDYTAVQLILEGFARSMHR